MKIVSNNRVLLVTFILTVLFSFNLSIPQLVQRSEAYPSVYVSEIESKNNPFYKTRGADQLIFDYFASSEKKQSDSNMNEMVNQLMNSLVQEKVARREICGGGQDNDGNGQVDENCNVSNIPQDNRQSPQMEPEQEICGDGQDNDGNGQVDENCNVSNIPQDNRQSTQKEPEQDKCGDGQDNDTNEKGDEKCNVRNTTE